MQDWKMTDKILANSEQNYGVWKMQDWKMTDKLLSGCWFHYGQALVKRMTKIGLKDAYLHDESVTDVIQCLLGLPLLPANDIVAALQDIRITIATDGSHSRQLQQLVAYVKRQWLDRRSVGPDRLCVRDNRARTNNVLESYHTGLRRRIQVSHPNLFNFLTHLQNVTVDDMADLQRLKRGVEIRRPKKREIFGMTPASRHASRVTASCWQEKSHPVYRQLKKLVKNISAN